MDKNFSYLAKLRDQLYEQGIKGEVIYGSTEYTNYPTILLIRMDEREIVVYFEGIDLMIESWLGGRLVDKMLHHTTQNAKEDCELIKFQCERDYL